MKKITALLLTVCFAVFAALTASAQAAGPEGLDVVFEENFEEYENDVNVNSTSMPSFFVCDYNSIGDGVICVQEEKNGNLYLMSHVFTQIYNAAPFVGAYEISMTVHTAQGKLQSGVFVRAPKTGAAYYEGDGNPDTSTCLSGVYICPHDRSIGVNIKTYGENAESTNFVVNNVTDFDLTDVKTYPYDLRITDDGETIKLFCNDRLVCCIVMSDPGKHYENHQASESPCFGAASIRDADGREIASYVNTLLQSDVSIVGWSTRASNMVVDNVVVKAEKAYAVQLMIDRIPSKITDKNVEDAAELISAARAAYDALPDGKKELVVNAQKLTKAEEEAAKLLPDTTEPVTEQPDTDAASGTAQTEPDKTDTDAPTDTVTSAGQTEVRVIDDSLAVWIIIAACLALIGAAAGFVAVKVRK